MRARGAVMLGALFVLGCASPPENSCATRSDEAGVSIDCDPDDDAWSQRAVEEAEEGFDGRTPGGRSP